MQPRDICYDIFQYARVNCETNLNWLMHITWLAVKDFLSVREDENNYWLALQCQCINHQFTQQ